MKKNHTSLENVNYTDQIDLLKKYFSKEQIGVTIMSALQKEVPRETGSNFMEYRRACAKNLKARLNEAISETRRSDFDSSKFYNTVLTQVEHNSRPVPKFKTDNECLYSALYNLSLKKGWLKDDRVVDLILNAQPNKADKNVVTQYNNTINDLAAKYYGDLERKINAA
ncbi:hypothetical protein HYU07_06315 [Candidatus Woesearchaeota archaeon]|nr:hypothetical protein [Candidatus Woesearchaeota archaeon]